MYTEMRSVFADPVTYKLYRYQAAILYYGLWWRTSKWWGCLAITVARWPQLRIGYVSHASGDYRAEVANFPQNSLHYSSLNLCSNVIHYSHNINLYSYN